MKYENIKRVLVPKGDNNSTIRQCLQELIGVEIPEFEDRSLVSESEGITFTAVRARDVPMLVQAGYADLGATGSDNCIEAGIDRFQAIGPRLGSFSLLCAAKNETYVARYLRTGLGKLIAITAYPRLLSQCVDLRQLNVEVSKTVVSGSVEAMPAVTGIPLAADLVCKGETADKNGLIVIESLYDVVPAVVQRSGA